MADYTTLPKPPTDTVVPGTGSAVQTATDPEGNKWQFDNEKGNWVNLSTGEAVSPKIFSQMAGRSGNAARDTVALAQAMRREEAALTPPTLRPPPPSPVALSQSPPPAAPLTPPTIGTGTTSPQAPVIPPNGQGILAPYSAPELARVAGQRPVPSTRVPPTPAAQEFYRQQLASFYLQRGMKPADVAKMVGIGMQPNVKPIHVGDALVNPQTGQAIYTAPPTPMTPYQRESLDERKRQFDAKQAQTEKQGAKLSPTDNKDYTSNATRLATIKRELDKIQQKGSAATLEERASFDSLFNEGMGLMDDQLVLKHKVSPLAPPAVEKPASAAPTGKATARDKAVRANALAIAHPEWSDAQIKAQVLKEMGR